MATQAEVDNLTQEATQIRDNLATAKTNIEERFAVLEKAIEDAGKGVKEAVDLTGLKEAISGLSTPSVELENLEPIAATPAPASTAAPQNADGTAQEHTTDPAQAQQQAADAASATSGGAQPSAEQEDAARSQV